MLGHRKLEVEDYIAIAKRRAILLLVPAVLFCIVGLVATRFIPAKYKSESLVLIQQQKVNDDIVKPVTTTSLDSQLALMQQQVLSRSRVQPIVERYNLYGTQHMDMDDRVDLAQKAIEVKPMTSTLARAGGLPGFTVTFKASDARTAQMVCQEVTTLFVNEDQRNQEIGIQGTSDFLKQQLADAKKNLDDQDAKMAAFQRQYVGKLPAQEGENVNMLTSLNTELQAATEQLARMEQDKSYAQSLLASQEQQAEPGAPAAEPVSGPDPVVLAEQTQLQNLIQTENDLASHYTAAYPDLIAVRRKIADLQAALAKPQTRTQIPGMPAGRKAPDTAAVQALRAQVHAADLGIQAKKREQNGYQDEIRMYQERIQASPLVEEQYKDLTRDYDTAQKFYDSLLARMNQANMASALQNREQGEQFTVIDAANLPDAPTFPVPWMFGAAGVFLGLAIGGGISALLEYKDTALRSDRDVWAFTNLPTLAIIAFNHPDLPEKLGKWARFRNLFRRKKKAESLAGAST